MKRIFTFWEPKGNIHPYLRLCMKTWKKFLPDYEIIVLDYSNIDNWLGEKFDKTLYEDYSLPKQADAIRCAILEQYGGIWLDTDTIITSEKFKQFSEISSDFILVGTHIGFIVAKQHSKILKNWLKGIKRRLLLHKLCKNKIIREFVRIFDKKFIKDLEKWNFLGNGILKKILKKISDKDFYSLDRVKLNIFPEKKYKTDYSLQMGYIDLYRYFYFNEDFSDYALHETNGFICLHNSWTPNEYKNMNEEEFLAQNNTLSNVLKKILY